MANDRHTPGPWKPAEAVGEDGERRIFSLSDALIAPANAYGDTPEQRDANARLIAAAPDMAAALQKATAMIDRLIATYSGGLMGNLEKQAEHEQAQARAALERAGL